VVVLLHWVAVPLTDEVDLVPDPAAIAAGEPPANGTKRREEMTAAENRGYKIFVYVSETAEQPVVLRLLERELHDPQQPTARIDGLKPMFFYNIQVRKLKKN
jgi:hypothetical protein